MTSSGDGNQDQFPAASNESRRAKRREDRVQELLTQGDAIIGRMNSMINTKLMWAIIGVVLVVAGIAGVGVKITANSNEKLTQEVKKHELRDLIAHRGETEHRINSKVQHYNQCVHLRNALKAATRPIPDVAVPECESGLANYRILVEEHMELEARVIALGGPPTGPNRLEAPPPGTVIPGGS